LHILSFAATKIDVAHLATINASLSRLLLYARQTSKEVDKNARRFDELKKLVDALARDDVSDAVKSP
jgi:hypothetical protein